VGGPSSSQFGNGRLHLSWGLILNGLFYRFSYHKPFFLYLSKETPNSPFFFRSSGPSNLADFLLYYHIGNQDLKRKFTLLIITITWGLDGFSLLCAPLLRKVAFLNFGMGSSQYATYRKCIRICLLKGEEKEVAMNLLFKPSMDAIDAEK
jgi:hypothetical protein